MEDFHAIRLLERGVAANAAPKNGEAKPKGGKGRKGSKAAASAAAAEPAAQLNGSRTARNSGSGAPATPATGTGSRSDADGGKTDAADDDSMTEDGGSGGGQRDGGAGGGDEEEEGGGEDASAEDAAAAEGMREWWHFMYHSRVGLRRFLGMDSLGRKYWLMAGRAGAYQVRLLHALWFKLQCGSCCNAVHAAMQGLVAGT